MARKQYTPTDEKVKEVLSQDGDVPRPLVQGIVQGLLEADMDQFIGGRSASARRWTAG